MCMHIQMCTFFVCVSVDGWYEKIYLTVRLCREASVSGSAHVLMNKWTHVLNSRALHVSGYICTCVCLYVIYISLKKTVFDLGRTCQ